MVAGALLVSLAGCSGSSEAPMPTQAVATLPSTSASGGTAQVTVVPAPSSKAAPVPVGAPTPPAVPGYSLNPSPATVLRRFQGVAGKFNGVFAGLTVRNVTKGQALTGTVVLLGLHPELVGNATVERGLMPGMIKGMAGKGAKTTTQRVGATEVAVATTKTTNIVAWYKGGTVVLVLGGGADPAPTLAFAKAYLGAH